VYSKKIDKTGVRIPKKPKSGRKYFKINSLDDFLTRSITDKILFLFLAMLFASLDIKENYL